MSRLHSRSPKISDQPSQVPLDYADPDASSAAIALIRITANVSNPEDGYQGPAFFNPGGPGISGVDYILDPQAGTYFSNLLGPTYDIVSFDPRGVSRSTPGVSFFESNLERDLWNDVPGAIDLNATQDALGLAFAKNRATARLAGERAGDILPFMTTENVARDMKYILDAYGVDKLLFWGISWVFVA